MKFKNVNKTKLVVVVIAVIIMGLCLAFLNKAKMGTDPCGIFNLGLASKLGISLGTCQALTNSFMFIFVWLYAKDKIGWGTLANMFLVGYSFDFFTWLNGLWIPDTIYSTMTGRVLVMIPSLLVFILVAATYMAVQLGTSPYDAVPFIISTKLPKVSFRVIRMCWDILACVVGVLLDSKLGLVTIVMAFALGPVIAWVKVNIVEKYL